MSCYEMPRRVTVGHALNGSEVAQIWDELLQQVPTTGVDLGPVDQIIAPTSMEKLSEVGVLVFPQSAELKGGRLVALDRGKLVVAPSGLLTPAEPLESPAGSQLAGCFERTARVTIPEYDVDGFDGRIVGVVGPASRVFAVHVTALGDDPGNPWPFNERMQDRAGYANTTQQPFGPQYVNAMIVFGFSGTLRRFALGVVDSHELTMVDSQTDAS